MKGGGGGLWTPICCDGVRSCRVGCRWCPFLKYRLAATGGGDPIRPTKHLYEAAGGDVLYVMRARNGRLCACLLLCGGKKFPQVFECKCQGYRWVHVAVDDVRKQAGGAYGSSGKHAISNALHRVFVSAALLPCVAGRLTKFHNAPLTKSMELSCHTWILFLGGTRGSSCAYICCFPSVRFRNYFACSLTRIKYRMVYTTRGNC